MRNGVQARTRGRGAVAGRDQLVSLVREVAVKLNDAASVQEAVSFTLKQLCTRGGWQAGFAYRREGDHGDGQRLRPIAGYYASSKYASLHDDVMSRPASVDGTFPQPGDGVLCTEDLGRAVSGAATAGTDLGQVSVVPVRSDGSVELLMELYSTARADLSEPLVMAIESVVAQLEHMLRRESAYRQLERQSGQLQSVLRAAADAIVTVRADGGIEDMNPAAERLFGMEREDMIGRHVATLLPAFSSPLPLEGLLGTIRTAGGLESEVRDTSGRILPVHVTVSEPLVEGEDASFVLAVRDFSVIRSAQRREVRQERLAAMGEMMTALAHESRNALQRIQSCLTLMELRGNPEVLSLVDDMQSAQDHLQRLYEEVRSYAAPLELRAERVDLGALIEEVWHELNPVWQPRGVQRQVESESGRTGIEADAERIGQVIRNVLENAIEASPDQGTITITLAREQVEDRPFVRVEIRNPGEPIPPELQQRAFDLLYSTKRGGTGMGLPISRRIVQEHGGDIGLSSSAESESAESGTVAVIRLPAG